MRERRPPVYRLARAVEYAAEDVVGVGDLQWQPQEAHLRAGGQTLATGENLQTGNVPIQSHHPRRGYAAVHVLHQREIAQRRPARRDPYHVPDDFQYRGGLEQVLQIAAGVIRRHAMSFSCPIGLARE